MKAASCGSFVPKLKVVKPLAAVLVIETMAGAKPASTFENVANHEENHPTWPWPAKQVW